MNHGYKAHPSPLLTLPVLWIDEAESIASSMENTVLDWQKKWANEYGISKIIDIRICAQGILGARKIERGTVCSLSAWCVSDLRKQPHIWALWCFFFILSELSCIELKYQDGWGKFVSVFSRASYGKTWTEVFDQPSNSSSLPFKKHQFVFFSKSAEASYHGIRTWRALES